VCEKGVVAGAGAGDKARAPNKREESGRARRGYCLLNDVAFAFWYALLLGYANLDNNFIILKSTELNSIDVFRFQTHFYYNQVK